MARTARTYTGGWGIDTSDLTDLVKALRTADRKVRREYRAGMRAVGAIVAEDARARVEPFSSKVARSITVRTAGANVEVRAGEEDEPLARLYEVGNDKSTWRRATSRLPLSSSSHEYFRHPVFANKENWADQKRHPFLRPALRAQQTEAALLLLRVTRQAMRSAGLKVE